MTSPSELAVGITTGMATGRAVDEAIAWYTREQARAWRAADPSRKAVDLARAMGVSEAQVSDLSSGRRGVGLKTAMGMAKVLGVSWDAYLLQAARAWLQRGPDAVLRVEYDERYPNRKRAIELVGDRFDPRAVKRVESIELKSDVDPHPLEWIKRLEAEQQRLEWEERDPEGVATKRDADAARLRELEEKHRSATGRAPDNGDDEEPPPEGSIEHRERMAKQKQSG